MLRNVLTQQRFMPAWCALVALLVLSPMTPDVSAALIHSDVMGDTVSFTGISEDSPSGDPLPLFDQPQAQGDSLDFDPTGDFSAMSIDGNGADLTDGKLNLMIEAKPGFVLSELDILESGLVTLFTLSGDPFAGVTGLVDIDIVEVDGAPIGQLNLSGLQLSFSPSNGDYQHSVDATTPLFSSDFTGSLVVDLVDALVANNVPFDFGPTKVNLTLNNTLVASTTADGSIAFIDKKDFDVVVTTEPGIPEPTTSLLAGLATLLAGCVIRRR